MPSRRNIHGTERDGLGMSEEQPVTTTDDGQTQDDFNYGIIRFQVGEISKLDEDGKTSPPVYIQGVPWRVCVCKEVLDDVDHLFIYLCCMENKSQMWRVTVKHDHVLVHSDISKTIVDKMGISRFNYETVELGASILPLSSLMEQGFLKDGKIIVEVRVWIVRARGIRTDTAVDFNNSTEPFHGLVLALDGEKLHVSKEFLSIHSPVFKSMFYGPYVEKDMQEISLKDVDPKEFKELLRVLYPSRYTVTDENLDVILKLADRFQIKALLDCAEDFLMTSTKHVLAKKLLLSDTYRLVHLQGHCLDKIKSLKAVKTLKNTPEYKSLSDRTKSALLEKMIELVE